MFKCDNCSTNCCNVNNCCGVNYIVGPQGPRGLQGAIGPTGAQGLGLQIDGSVNSVEDLPKNNPKNGDAFMVGTSNPKYLYTFDARQNQWINQGTIQGPKGDRGATGATGPIGPQGIQGEGLQIDGTVATVAQLPVDAFNGMTYLVGVADPKILYVYDGNLREWINEGTLQGPKGDKGDGLQIDGIVNTVVELPTDPFNGMTYLVGVREPRTLFIYNEMTGEWVNEGQLHGEKGDTGEPGKGLTILATVDTVDDLPPLAENGDAYMVGVDVPRELYIYDETAGEFVNQGTLQGPKGDTGPTFYSAYGNFYSTVAQTFTGGTEYSTIMLQQSGEFDSIVLDAEGYFSFVKAGLYLVTYAVTISDFTELTTIALLDNNGVAKSTSVQGVKTANTQTSLTFLARFDTTRKWRLGVLSDTDVEMTVPATQLINANITFLQIPKFEE